MSEHDRTIDVALVGVAHTPHAMSYGRSLVNGARTRLVAVFDTDRQLGEAAATRFGVPYYDDLEALFAAHELDAIVVCSATDEHRPLVEAAAERGLHVMCEKPIATTLADAEAMIGVCADNGVQLHIAFVTRFYPVVQRVRAAIAGGAIGDVIGMVGGNRGLPPLAPQYPAWITDVERAGGGAVIDHSVHVVDVMRHLTGREVVGVNAEIDDRFWESGVDDMAAVSLTFDGGAIASVDPSWSVPTGNPWGYDFFLRVLGSKGTVRIDDSRESLRLVYDGRLALVPFGVDIDAAMIDAFAESVQSGAVVEPCAVGEDGYRALEVALAAYQAAASSGTVTLAVESGA